MTQKITEIPYFEETDALDSGHFSEKVIQSPFDSMQQETSVSDQTFDTGPITNTDSYDTFIPTDNPSDFSF